VPIDKASKVKRDMAQSFGISGDEYQYGFETHLKEVDAVPPGLSEDIIRVGESLPPLLQSHHVQLISAKKREPDWLLEFRLNAYRVWQTMKEPHWAYFN